MKIPSIAMVCLLGSAAIGQSSLIGFEPQTTPTCTTTSFPTPCGTLGDPEGISYSAQTTGGYATRAVGANGLGFPSGGTHFLRAIASGVVGVNPSPAGGPLPRPTTAGTVVCIPIPSGATGVNFNWDFYNGEGTTTTYNDGISIDVVDATGSLVYGLVYADAATSVPGGGIDSTGSCPSFYTETAPSGLNPFSGVFGAIPSGASIMMTVWNGGDDAVDSEGVIDDIQFTGNVCSWSLTHPSGPGSIQISVSNCAPGAVYFQPVGFTAGAFPNGWALGVDLTITDFLTEVSAGPPFLGSLSPSGGLNFGPFSGLPVGVTIYVGFGLFQPNLTTQFPPLAFTF